MGFKKNLHLVNSISLDKQDFAEFLQELGFDNFRVIVPNLIFSSWPLIRDFKNPTFAQYENWWEDYNSLKEVLHCRFSLYDNIYIWQGLHTINTQIRTSIIIDFTIWSTWSFTNLPVVII